MKVRKAVITAAGKDQRLLPLQRLVDRDGQTKTALQVLLEETLSAGVEEIGVVCFPGDEAALRGAAKDLAGRVQLMPQQEARGYGHAVLCARTFVGDEPFLHLVGDHLCLSETKQRCAQQLVEAAQAEKCSVSAVQATRESLLADYGIVGGRRVANRRDLYQVEQVIEKPTPTEAEQHLLVPGLRAGYYLGFFGMHVLTPAVMEFLAQDQSANIGLSPALAKLAARERYLALEVQGRRFNLGEKYGPLTAQLAFALSGADRDAVLVQLLELAAHSAR